jgi:regulator of PEP synthase PpsR (kinase-PPPase family)
MYLANRGYKVANVPLVPEVALIQEIFQLEPEKIVGLIVDPLKLKSIRLERLRSIGLDGAPGYASLERVERELAYAKEVFLRLGCRVIDVTNQAVEETANRVLKILEEKS